MNAHELQIQAGAEWHTSRELRRRFATPEHYWWERYQRIYCPRCRADWRMLRAATSTDSDPARRTTDGLDHRVTLGSRLCAPLRRWLMRLWSEAAARIEVSAAS
jgi:hypothetical protein